MPITIAPIAPQNIVINTAYTLPISITDNPDTVEVKGLQQGFSYSYDSGTCRISGAASRLVNNAIWTITAKKGNQIVTSDITYNVLLPAPIIPVVPKQFIPKGVEYSLSIPIENNPSDVIVTGHIIGLKQIGSNPVRISGIVPVDANFTIKNGTFVVTAKNSDGTHTRNIEWEFASHLYAVDNAGDKVYVISSQTPDQTEADALSVFDLPSHSGNPSGAAVDGNDLYIIDLSDRQVFVIPANTENAGTATATRAFKISYTNVGGLTVDADNIYLIDNSGYIRIYDKNSDSTQTLSPTRSFRAVTNSRNHRGLTNDGTFLYVLYQDTTDTTYKIAVVRKDTANNATATIERKFPVPSTTGIAAALVLKENDLYYVSTDDSVYVLPKNTVDGAAPVVSRSFNLPTAARNVSGIG